MEKIVVSGKRKACIARATILEGNGIITINKKPYEILPLFRRLMIEEPLKIAKNTLGSINYDISVNVAGGGAASKNRGGETCNCESISKNNKFKRFEKSILKLRQEPPCCGYKKKRGQKTE